MDFSFTDASKQKFKLQKNKKIINNGNDILKNQNNTCITKKVTMEFVSYEQYFPPLGDYNC